MITEAIKRQHAERISTYYTPEKRKLLKRIARRLNCWGHVDWDAVDYECPQIIPCNKCDNCGRDIPNEKGIWCDRCRNIRRAELEGIRKSAKNPFKADLITNTLPDEDSRLCPDCDITALRPRQRVCEGCRIKRRRATLRKQKQRQRMRKFQNVPLSYN